MITTLLSDWIICSTLMTKNSSVATTFILQSHFSSKAEIKYKNSSGISYEQGTILVFLSVFFLAN